MRKRFLLLGLMMALPVGAWAKRLPPPVVLPVDDGVYRFVVRENSRENRHHLYKGGHLEAYLKATGDQLWDKYLYMVQVDPKMERDVQDVFIYKAYLAKPNLLIAENEDGTRFALDRRTGELIQKSEFQRDFKDRSMYYLNTDRVEPIVGKNYLIEADDSVSFGRQKVRAFDLPTGRLLWEQKVPIPKVKKGGRSRISILWLNKKEQLEITFGDNSESLVDTQTGKVLRTDKND
ncbi:MAG TPA: hypothetical protein VIJ93_05865 [bacterium]